MTNPALLRRPLLVNCGWSIAAIAGSSVFANNPSWRSNVVDCRGAFSNSNSTLSIFSDSDPLDLRTLAGSDRAWNDLVVTDDGNINIWGSEGPTFLGGANVRLNSDDVFGRVTAYDASPLIAQGIIIPKSYTVATVPSATTYAGGVIYVTNGDSGNPCLAVAQGGTWKRIALGTTIST